MSKRKYNTPLVNHRPVASRSSGSSSKSAIDYVADSINAANQAILGTGSRFDRAQFHGGVPNTGLDDLLSGLNTGNLPSVSNESIGALDQFIAGYGNENLSTAERTDMLMQYILQLMAKDEQRSYDKTVLDEQRTYDSPTNQLARLMGAGISRDAAIQLLSSVGGSGSGALVGSGSNVTAPSVSGVSGSADIARKQMIIGGIAEIANTLVNLCSAGMSMAQAYQTYQFQKSQNYMSNEQVLAYDAANNVNQQLQSLADAGVFGDADINDVRSTNDLIKFLRSYEKDSPAVKDLLNSDAFKRATGTIFGREQLNGIMATRRSSRDAGKIADMAITQAELQNNLLAIDQERLSADVAKLRAETKLIDAQTQETMSKIALNEANIQVLDKQGKFIQVQTDQARLNYEISATGLPLLKQARQDALRLQAAKFRALFDPEKRSEAELRYGSGDPLGASIVEFLQDPVNAADAAYLTELHNGALAGFAEEHPTLWKLACIFHDTGVGKYIKTGLDVGALLTNVLP